MNILMKEESSGDISAKGKSKIPPVHVNEMTWKRYLAPLPEHRGTFMQGINIPDTYCLLLVLYQILVEPEMKVAVQRLDKDFETWTDAVTLSKDNILIYCKIL